MRSSAASRLRSCERCSEALTVRTPSTSRRESRSSTRARWTGPSALVLATSRLSSTRESAVLTDWPPGPDERLNRHASSRSGITTERVTRNGPGIGSFIHFAREDRRDRAGGGERRGRREAVLAGDRVVRAGRRGARAGLGLDVRPLLPQAVERTDRRAARGMDGRERPRRRDRTRRDRHARPVLELPASLDGGQDGRDRRRGERRSSDPRPRGGVARCRIRRVRVPEGPPRRPVRGSARDRRPVAARRDGDVRRRALHGARCGARTRAVARHLRPGGGVRPADEALDAALAAEGRDPATLERTVGIEVRDPSLGAAEPGDDEEGEDRTFGGSVDELAEAIAAYDELGIGHLIVVLQPMTEASLERLALAVARR